MAAANYYNVAAQIKAVIAADPAGAIGAADVQIEQLPILDPQGIRKVYILTDDRQAPAGEQMIMAGKSTDFLVTYSIWCFGFHLDEGQDAAKMRDDLMGAVEVAIMNDRTLNGSVRTCWIEGGAFEAADGNGIFRAGEIRLTCHMQALR